MASRCFPISRESQNDIVARGLPSMRSEHSMEPARPTDERVFLSYVKENDDPTIV